MIFQELPQTGRRSRNLDRQFRCYTWWAVGTAVVSAAGSYLSRPKAPKEAAYNPVDLGQSQTDAIQGNISNESSIEDLIKRSNLFSQNQASSLAELAMPGYQKLSGALTDRATTLAQHPYDVPKEVQDNLQRIAAEKGISGGTRGQFNDFSLLRDFGVNQLQYGQQNLSQAQSITGLLATIAPKVNPMSPMSFYVNPQQALNTTTNNNQTQQGIAQGGNNANAAAANAGNADMWNSLTQLAGLYGGIKSNQASGGTSAQKTQLAGDSLF